MSDGVALSVTHTVGEIVGCLAQLHAGIGLSEIRDRQDGNDRHDHNDQQGLD